LSVDKKQDLWFFGDSVFFTFTLMKIDLKIKMGDKKNISAIVFIAVVFVMLLTAFSASLTDRIGNQQLKDSLFAENQLVKADGFADNNQSDSAIALYQKAAASFLKHKMHENYIQCQIKIADAYRSKYMLEQALLIGEAAKDYALKNLSANHIVIAELNHSLGTIQKNLGNDDEAISLFNQSIRKRVQLNGNKDTLLSNTYNNLGNVYYYLGLYDDAFRYYQRSLNLVKYRKDQENRAVMIWNQNLAGCYQVFGDYTNAEKYYQHALDIALAIYEENDAEFGRIYTNLGAMQIRKGDYDKALYFFKKAEPIYYEDFKPNTERIGILYLNIGVVYQNKTDFKKALDYFNKALNIFTNNYEDHPQVSKTLRNIGIIHKELREFDKAIEYFDSTLTTRPDPVIYAKTLKSLAEIYIELKDYNRANSFFENAIGFTTSNIPKEKSLLASLYNSYGISLLHQKRQSEALSYHNSALTILKELYPEKNVFIAENYSYLADVYFTRKSYWKAAQYYQKALIANTIEFSSSDLSKNPKVSSQCLQLFNQSTYLRRKAASLFLHYKLKDDFNNPEIYFNALDIVSEICDQLSKSYNSSTEVSQLALNEHVNNLLHTAIEISSFMYNRTNDNEYMKRLYKYVEKSKASSLLSLIRSDKAAKIANIPNFILDLEKDIQTELGNYERLIEEEKQSGTLSSKKIDFWQNEIFRLTRIGENLTSYLETHYPSYYNYKYNTSISSLKEVQNSIRENDVLIEYKFADSTLVIIAITPKNITVKSMPNDTSFTRQLKKFRNILQNPVLSRHYIEDIYHYQKEAYSLYKSLLKPIEGAVAG
jgi:tetratricopeptide (TPR) repeat protein